MRSRIGWLVRMARTLSPEPFTLQQMSAATDASTTQLHRLETGAIRDGLIVDGYEQALALPLGSLRSAIDVTCRTFPAVSPRDSGAESQLTTVRQVSEATERLLDAVRADEVARPGDWLVWARAMSMPGRIGLPESVAAELVRALVLDLGRSIAPGYSVRYEALSLLRCSLYGHVVVEAARDYIAPVHVQKVADLMSAVAEAVDPEVTALAMGLLRDPRDPVFEAAVVALENLAAIAPDREVLWAPLVPALVDVYVDTSSDEHRWKWMSHLLRLVPPAQLSPHFPRLPRGPAPTAAISDWSTTSANSHWADCEARARQVCSELDTGYQPMIARLIFDLGMSPYQTRAVTSFMLVGALPGLPAAFSRQLLDIAARDEDPVIRQRAARRLGWAQWDHFPDTAAALVHAADDDLRTTALSIAGSAGVHLPVSAYDAAIARPDARRGALAALGMAGHPHLATVAASHPDAEVRGIAQWWLDGGSRRVP